MVAWATASWFHRKGGNYISEGCHHIVFGLTQVFNGIIGKCCSLCMKTLGSSSSFVKKFSFRLKFWCFLHGLEKMYSPDSNMGPFLCKDNEPTNQSIQTLEIFQQVRFYSQILPPPRKIYGSASIP